MEPRRVGLKLDYLAETVQKASATDANTRRRGPTLTLRSGVSVSDFSRVRRHPRTEQLQSVDHRRDSIIHARSTLQAAGDFVSRLGCVRDTFVSAIIHQSGRS